MVHADRDKQTEVLITYTENRVTNAVEESDAYRTPLPCETCTFELTGYTPSGNAARFQASDFVETDPIHAGSLIQKFDREIKYEEVPTTGRERRLIEHVRTLYRRDDLSDLLPWEKWDPWRCPATTSNLPSPLGWQGRFLLTPAK